MGEDITNSYRKVTRSKTHCNHQGLLLSLQIDCKTYRQWSTVAHLSWELCLLCNSFPMENLHQTALLITCRQSRIMDGYGQNLKDIDHTKPQPILFVLMDCFHPNYHSFWPRYYLELSQWNYLSEWIKVKQKHTRYLSKLCFFLDLCRWTNISNSNSRREIYQSGLRQDGRTQMSWAKDILDVFCWAKDILDVFSWRSQSWGFLLQSDWRENDTLDWSIRLN